MLTQTELGQIIVQSSTNFRP